jgi:NADPH:quinone reductase-like Zn-dependent oxidoreductase
MRAAVLHKLGQSPRCEEFSDPTAGEGEVVVHVRAAALKPVDRQMAQGTHYASPRVFPVVCGSDGVGVLPGGERVYFGARPPYGAMAERTVVKRAFCFPIPDGLDDTDAAALPNPGVSAWLTLVHRANLKPGENALILGATGVTGRLAVKIAKILGARRVVAAGRNAQVLSELLHQGADATIRLDTSDGELRDAFLRTGGDAGFQVVIDYVWGHPVEVFLSAITRNEFANITSEIRLVQVGESAGATISLPAAVLRSTAISIMGTAGIPPSDVLLDAIQQVMTHGAKGNLRVDIEAVPLAEIESAWVRNESGKRLVVIP